MKIFQKVQEIWSGQESVTEGQMDGQTDGRMGRRTDEGHFYNPPSALRWGIKKHNFKIPRAHVCPQTTSKMPVKFQKHLLKAVGGVVLTSYLLLFAFS